MLDHPANRPVLRATADREQIAGSRGKGSAGCPVTHRASVAAGGDRFCCVCIPPLLSHVAAWASEHQRTRLALVFLGLLPLAVLGFGCGAATLGLWAMMSDSLGDLALPGSKWLEDYASTLLFLSMCVNIWIMPNISTLTQLGKRAREAWTARKRQQSDAASESKNGRGYPGD